MRRTECPRVPTQCPRIPTVCPRMQTHCPAEQTQCPENRTECPVEQGGGSNGLRSGAFEEDTTNSGSGSYGAQIEENQTPPASVITGSRLDFFTELHNDTESPWGLAYREISGPDRLYLSDKNAHWIDVYGIQKDIYLEEDYLSHKPEESFSTTDIDSAFVRPLDLAYADMQGVPTLFAISSEDWNEDGSYNTSLWRVTLNDGGTPTAESLDLNLPVFGIDGKAVYGLAFADGLLYVSYDTNGFKSDTDKVRRGVLKLRVLSESGKTDWWAVLQVGHPMLVEGDVPHAAKPSREDETGQIESVSHCRGLAAFGAGNADYFVGTVSNKRLFISDARAGRGAIWFKTGANSSRGLAVGGDALWAVQQRYVSGSGQTWGIQKIALDPEHNGPFQSGRAVRHLSIELTSAYVLPPVPLPPFLLPVDGLKHNFMRPPSMYQRESQHRDPETYDIRSTREFVQSSLNYSPAGDSDTLQKYFEVAFFGLASYEPVKTTFEFDFWTSNYGFRLYPHRANDNASPSPSYLSNSTTVYDLGDTDIFEDVYEQICDDMAAEYGSSALDSNPYWQTRNVLEFILENYTYDNVNNPYGYNPASNKLALVLDSDADNNQMTCSSSAFAMAGMLRYIGIPARWVGTTRMRYPDNATFDSSGEKDSDDADGVWDWDLDADRFLGPGEEAEDTTFHRWIEVWLGDNYGWQRMDPTPEGDGPFELSQWELMTETSKTTGVGDLVMQVGNGKVSAFHHFDGNQRYNAVAKYDGPLGPVGWVEGLNTNRSSSWSNATLLAFTSIPSQYTAGTTTVSWDATGRWDMDPEATVTLQAKQLTCVGTGCTVASDPITVAGRVPASDEVAPVNLCGLSAGTYRWELFKDNDRRTGTCSDEFTVSGPIGCP